MQSNLKTLTQILPGISEEDLLVSLKEPAMHIFDAIVVRAQLETRFGLEIPDADWNRFHCLAEALQYCERALEAGAKVNCKRMHKIGMPQMANAALSENWLLKEMGDIHWAMLSSGLGQQSSEFTDACGNRLYAAFVRISYSISPLNAFRENDTLELAATMQRYEECVYTSRVSGACAGKTIEAHLMTSFLARRHNDNSQIARSLPELTTNRVPRMPDAPSFYTEHRQLKKGRTDEIASGGYTFRVTGEKVASIEHTINPHFEINGAGLLYFASYPIIADTCATAFFKRVPGMEACNKEYHTVFRDVFFFANCNADDEIIVDLNSVTSLPQDKLQLVASLYRRSDKKFMARILTVKQRS